MEINSSLYNGDCFEILEKMILNNVKVDMILVDLPYGITACEWDKQIELNIMWGLLEKILKKGGAAVFTSSQPFTTKLISSNIDNFKYSWIWEKNRATNFVNANKQPLKAHEDIVVFIDGASFYNPQKTKGHKRTNRAKVAKQGAIYNGNMVRGYKGGSTERYPRSVLKFDTERGLHPTQKPVSLMEYLIKSYTKEAEIVLDFCMGSGTTGVAAKNTNRNFIGVEKNKEYFEIAVKRIEREGI